MLADSTLRVVSTYWATEMGLPVEHLFDSPLTIIPHGERLMDYDGVFALFRGSAVIISFPPDRMKALRPRLPGTNLSPALLAAAFSEPPLRVIGPAYIGYAEAVLPASGNVRALSGEDAHFAGLLQSACSETEWDHGGSEIGAVPASGAFDGKELAALAGYEVWDGAIAHISVLTHPSHRGCGHGRRVVAHLAERALAAGLVPQYRTLESNAPSMRIAGALGFVPYATSVAVRLGGMS